MNFLKRLGYYLGGFSAGLIFLAFFFNGKKTQCNYGPEARVLNDLSKKEWRFAKGVYPVILLDSLSINTFIEYADVDFSSSKTSIDSCKVYQIETELELKKYALRVENCKKNATILKIEVLD